MVVAALGLGTTAYSQSLSVVAKKSNVKWDARKASGSGHYGTLQLKSGTIILSDNKIKSADIVADMTTIVNTDGQDGQPNARLVGHLKNDDFFSVDQFSTAKFVLTGSSEFKNGEAKVYGRLTIKDITHPINFTVKREGNKFATKLQIDRTKYDIKYGSGKFFSDLGDRMILDEFTLEIELQVKEV